MTSVMRTSVSRHLLLSGRRHPPLQTEALPPVSLLLVLALQVDIIIIIIVITIIIFIMMIITCRLTLSRELDLRWTWAGSVSGPGPGTRGCPGGEVELVVLELSGRPESKLLLLRAS